jgi:hypothetical protein
MIAKQNSAPKDSQDGYHGIKMRTFGCKLPAKKNEGMAEGAGSDFVAQRPNFRDFSLSEGPEASKFERPRRDDGVFAQSARVLQDAPRLELIALSRCKNLLQNRA